jgi:hypothetical protein
LAALHWRRRAKQLNNRGAQSVNFFVRGRRGCLRCCCSRWARPRFHSRCTRQRIQASSLIFSGQVHSYDDLRAWPALVSRGISYFKVDLAYVTEADCKRLGDAHRNCTGGAFLLTHDDPSSHPSVDFFDGDDLEDLCATSLTNVTVALCGKGGGGGECDPAYLARSDELFAALIRLEKSRGLAFILDGSFASPTAACLAERWKPWVKTWQGQPVEAFVSNDCSGNATLCRFQVFDTPIADEPEVTFLPFAVLQYGKFSLQSSYPLLVWEPSDQSVIRETAKIYATHAKVPRGLRFAINISPERFQVFAADYAKTAWNYKVPSSGNLTSPRAFALSSSDRVLLFGWNETSGSVAFQWLQYNQWLGTLAPVRPFVSAPGLKDLWSTQLVNDSSVFLSGSSSALVYDFVNQRTLSHFSAPIGLQVFSAVWTGSLSSVVWIGRSDGCSLLVGSACVVSAGDATIRSASAASVSENEIAIAYATENFELYFGTLTLGKSASSFVQFGVGSRVSVSYAASNVLVSADDSFCYNSEYMNKEVILFCSAPPTSTAGVLAYWTGPLDAWRANTELISPCNPAFRSGSFDQGSQSGVSLDAAGRLLEAHVGASFEDQYAPCGLADEYDGVVIDSFPIH